MVILILLYSMTPPITPSTSQQQQQVPLRRATYIHVSDLTSAYNINNEQLEIEMSRVNAKRKKDQDRSSGNNESKDRPTQDKDPDLEKVGPIIPQKRLQPPRGGFNLCVLIGKVNLVVDKRRVDRSRVRLAEVEIGDETGIVSLRARDEQIDLLERFSKCKPGAVVLRNCTLELYQGKHIRLAVTKWGKLAEYPDNVASTPGPPPSLNKDRNFSLIDLSVVASEIIEKVTSQSQASASRQTKSSECENGSGSSSPSKISTSKPGQQTHTKHQQSRKSRSGSNRSSNERRQFRGSHYGGMRTEFKQPPRQGQVVYHGGIQGYHHGYKQQNIDIRTQQQYRPTSYAHSARAQQDVVSVQFALRQQYEMQQRQLHQLYNREQNRPSGQTQQQQSQMFVRPIMNSFEASTGTYVGDIPRIGNSHLTGIPRENMIEITSSRELVNLSTKQDGSHNTQPSLNPVSTFVIGKMNPEAMAYAPSYNNAVQGPNPQQQVPILTYQSQFNYDLSRPFPNNTSNYPPLQLGHHPTYAQGGITPGAMMYHHTPQTDLNTPMDQDGGDST